MKRINTRTVLVILLACASISSYIFLTSVSRQAEEASVELEQVDAESTDQTELLMPDVQMVKKLLEASRRIMEITR